MAGMTEKTKNKNPRFTQSTHLRREWPVSIEKVLGNSQFHDLQRMIRHAQRLLKINEIVCQYLPQEIRKFCQVMQSNPSELTIGVTSATWLTRLRYLESDFLMKLKQHPQLIHLQKIKFRIQSIC